MNADQHLQKRHGSSSVNVDLANIFAAIFFALFISYSLLAVLNARCRLRLDKLLKIAQSTIFQVFLWTLLCAFGIFARFTTNPYQLARRYGQLSLASATITVFLSLKPAPLPQTYHAPLVMLHKWTGRTSIAFAFGHGGIYIGAYIRSAIRKHHKNEFHDKRAFYVSSSLFKRHSGHHSHSFFGFENIFGMISIVAFMIILISSLKFIRRRMYNVFYALHRPLVILVYVLMIWHSRPSSWLLVPLGLCLIVSQLVMRALLTSRLNIVKLERFGPSLLLISFTCSNGIIDFSKLETTNRIIDSEVDFQEPDGLASNALSKAGTYIRIARPMVNPVEFFKASHPYTLAGPGKLVVRESRRFRFDETLEYCAYGPFKSSLDLTKYTHILVFVGGSGISIAPSIVANSRSRYCHVVWATRNASEAEILPHLQIKDCSVYVTTRGVAAVKYTEDGYELDSTEFDLDGDADGEQALLPTGQAHTLEPGIHQFSGRPDIEKIVNLFYQEGDSSKLCVISCGPESLVAEVSKWCANKNHDSWTEIFAL